MKKILSLLSLAFLSTIVFVACSKEYSTEKDENDGSLATYGWEMTGNNKAYKGCVDTAAYGTIAGVRVLGISLSDASNNAVQIGIPVTSGNIKTGSYVLNSGAFIQFTTNGGVAYSTAGTGASIEIVIKNSSSTEVEGTFSAVLNPLAGTGNQFTIKDGKFKALLRATNPCGATPPPTSNGGFTIPTCNAITVQGTYTAGVATTSANTVTIPVNVTALGSWTANISAVNGLSFSGSGTFTSTGNQNIILRASGTPATAGTINITVTAGSTTCTFTVVVGTGVTPGTFTATVDGTNFTFNTDAKAVITTPAPGMSAVEMTGLQNSTGTTAIRIGVAKPGSITNGTYTINQMASNIIVGSTYTDAANAKFSIASSMTPQTPVFTVTITSVSATRIAGTFEGPLKDAAGAGAVQKTVTLGTFDLPIQ